MIRKATLAAAAFFLLSAAGCGAQNTIPTGAGESAASQTSVSAPAENQGSRLITDLGGNQVEIPPVSEIQKVVIITPPVTSVLLEVIPDKNMIVGLSPKSFAFSNAEVMAKLFPKFKEVDTSFVGDNFAVNAEALLQLNPDIILYYGEIQKKGLVNTGLPIIDFFPKGKSDPKDVSIAWDNLLREIFEKDSSEGLQSEWAASDQKSREVLEKQTGGSKSALCIFSNAGGSLVVSGSSSFDSYAQSFFEKAGLRNAASGISGTAEVSMEQIYQWNPDMIFVFHNAPAQAILNNTIEGQDWSLLTAWKNKAVYDIPQTAYSWVTPCADSPLMPLWLISKAYPELYSEAEFRSELSAYYERLHRVTLTDAEMDSVLALRKLEK